jgi:guanylate cyclase
VDVPAAISVTFLGLNVVGVALATFLMLRYFVGERDRLYGDLRVEREKSERLLLNVLPGPIAERLKEGEEVIADAHADVTVLFADLVDFTPLSDRIPPEDLVALLNRVFSAFDDLADRHGMEKIKTIGDAYMAAAGIPTPRPGHADAAAAMSLEVLREVGRTSAEAGVHLSVRVGIESGPVVAGVIGRRKFIYDLWGDTVNLASRMESQGVPGAVQVGPRAHRLLRERWRFERRGPVDVKGKGPIVTHLLLGPVGGPS